MDMKRLCVMLVVLMAVISLLPVTAMAHPGKTDANGGHYDREAGEYHYHHGYPAHQHTDLNGDGVKDCPYNFDDQTDHSSRNSSGSSSMDKNYIDFNYDLELTVPDLISTMPTVPAREQPTASGNNNEVACEEKGKEIIIPIWGFAVVCVLACAFLILTIKYYFKSKRIQDEVWEIESRLNKANNLQVEARKSEVTAWNEFRQCAEKNTELEQKLNIAEKNKENYDALVEIMGRAVPFSDARKLSDYSMDEPIPESILYGINPKISTTKYIVFDRNEMPIPVKIGTEHGKPYGDYTVYVNVRGSVYHCDSYCAGYSTRTLHLFDAIGKYRPCAKCTQGKGVPLEVPQWYRDIKKIRDIQKGELGAGYTYERAFGGVIVRIPKNKAEQWKKQQNEIKKKLPFDPEETVDDLISKIEKV